MKLFTWATKYLVPLTAVFCAVLAAPAGAQDGRYGGYDPSVEGLLFAVSVGSEFAEDSSLDPQIQSCFVNGNCGLGILMPHYLNGGKYEDCKSTVDGNPLGGMEPKRPTEP